MIFLLVIAIVLTLLPIGIPVVQAADAAFTKAGDTKTYGFEDAYDQLAH